MTKAALGVERPCGPASRFLSGASMVLSAASGPAFTSRPRAFSIGERLVQRCTDPFERRDTLPVAVSRVYFLNRATPNKHV